jgi:formate--tetrahydrofolate ligase
LRHIVTGIGGRNDGPLRETGTDISAASEIMAIVALAKDSADLRQRLNDIVIGWTEDRKPVTAGDVQAVGSMMVLLKDAIKPNLVQTQEGNPVVAHAGPFGNIAHGCSSIIADTFALPSAEFVCTEAGFGADLGFEKFMDIKVRQGGAHPSAGVVVATIRGLKWHGGVDMKDMATPNVAAVEEGTANLKHAIGIVQRYGLPVVVAINRFPDDHPDEIAAVQRAAAEAGAKAAIEAKGFAEGGEGMRELATAVAEAAESGEAKVKLLYKDDARITEKVDALAKNLFKAGSVTWGPMTRTTATRFEENGWNFPICVAKTHLSISANPRLRGAPEGHVFPVQELRIAAGSRQVIALAGDIMTLPGLPQDPNAFDIDLTADGEVVGLL